METKVTDYLAAQSTRAEFIVTTVITGTSWWDCMSRNLPLSIMFILKGALHIINMARMKLHAIDGDQG